MIDYSTIPVSSLDLSARAARCLSNMGVKTLADLMKYSPVDFLRNRNFGKTSLQQLHEALYRHGVLYNPRTDEYVGNHKTVNEYDNEVAVEDRVSNDERVYAICPKRAAEAVSYINAYLEETDAFIIIESGMLKMYAPVKAW